MITALITYTTVKTVVLVTVAKTAPWVAGALTVWSWLD